jgi:hypothetical protein
MDGEVQYVSEFEDRYHFHLFIFGILSTYVIFSVDNLLPGLHSSSMSKSMFLRSGKAGSKIVISSSHLNSFPDAIYYLLSASD